MFDVTNQKIQFKDQKYDNCILINYHLDLDTFIDDSESFINKFITFQTNTFFNLFSILFSFKYEIVIKNYWLDGKEIDVINRLDKLPITLYNTLNIFNIRPTQIFTNYVVSNSLWQNLEKLIIAFRGLSTDQQNKLKLSLRWYNKAAIEQNSLDRLFAFWVGFNSLYENPDKTETEAIKLFIQENIRTNLAKTYIDRHINIVQQLINFPITLGKTTKRRDISEEIKNILKAKTDYVNNVKLICLAIYAIRNDLFHGASDPDLKDEQAKYELSEILLSDLLKQIIYNYIMDDQYPEDKMIINESASI